MDVWYGKCLRTIENFGFRCGGVFGYRFSSKLCFSKVLSGMLVKCKQARGLFGIKYNVDVLNFEQLVFVCKKDYNRISLAGIFVFEILNEACLTKLVAKVLIPVLTFIT
jgi:hypothetical protein